MSSSTPTSPDPGPERTPGPAPGGGVPPGETPPGEDSTAGAGPRETYNPTRGWAAGPIIAIGTLVIVFVVTVIIWATLI
ncbi:hypothetical protein I5Q34_01535 [Streptomyces sp. AV19]|uniref:DUF6480 family protein n=1 Tax=Streptomyces sp. AV19 TaxID=2793068 RepID=UPI0018FF0EEE|nr:DUF6480 family protein [Streptomyces sp. AV19]MBH1932984.1 hypothetical protein [Streptomyces sp. AV19]MDG4533845.1 DUF6480 family protein [Streptomyces sp. AV19]